MSDKAIEACRAAVEWWERCCKPYGQQPSQKHMYRINFMDVPTHIALARAAVEEADQTMLETPNSVLGKHLSVEGGVRKV